MIDFPYAKINIGLSVNKKRKDGFHEIETILMPVDLCDALEIVENSTEAFKYTTSGIKIDSEIKGHLCYKAWGKIKSHFSINGVQLHLHKNIPIGAGLGGGSSDAAFTLKMLNQFFELKIPKNELKAIVAEIGNDCPFFIDGKASYAFDKGQLLEQIDLDLKAYQILIVYPHISISTKWAYESITPRKKALPLTELIRKPIEAWRDLIKNDFEQVVFQKYPEIEIIKSKLYEKGAVYASLSGSGSAVYGLFKKIPVIKNSFKDYFIWHGRIGFIH